MFLDICISCDDPKEKVVAQHPLFHGGLCDFCKVKLQINYPEIPRCYSVHILHLSINIFDPFRMR